MASVHRHSQSIALFHSQISMKTVEQARDALIQQFIPKYLEIASYNKERLDNSYDHIRGGLRISTEYKHALVVYEFGEKREDIGSARYHIDTTCSVEDLQKDNPLATLLFEFKQKIDEQGFARENATFDVRLDKGAIVQNNNWHKDHLTPFALTTCFSNVTNWCTRFVTHIPDQTRNEMRGPLRELNYKEQMRALKYVFELEGGYFQLDEVSAEQYSDHATHFDTTREWQHLISLPEIRPTLHKHFEPLAITGEHGAVYDAHSYMHRAPRESDLECALKIDDWRLFIRYRPNKY